MLVVQMEGAGMRRDFWREKVRLLRLEGVWF